jgi:hypothetical protein
MPDPTANVAAVDSAGDDIDIEERHTRGQVRMAEAMHKLFAGRLIHVPSVGWFYRDSVRWRLDELEKSTRFVPRSGMTSVSSVSFGPPRR